MNYKELLTKAEKENIDVLSLMTAYEVKNVLTNRINDSQFEVLCNKIVNAYFRDNRMSIMHVVKTIKILIVDDGYSLEKILSMDDKTFDNEVILYSLID